MEKESNDTSGTSEPQHSGIMGMNEKLGFFKKTRKVAPKVAPQPLGFSASLPSMPDVSLRQRSIDNSFGPGVNSVQGSGGPVDKAKNRVARSFSGGNKQEIFNGR